MIWLRNVKRKSHLAKFFITATALLTAFVFTSTLRSTAVYSTEYGSAAYAKQANIDRSYLRSFRNIRDSAIEKIKNIGFKSTDSNEDGPAPLLNYHPFDNKCKYPLPNTYAEDIYQPYIAARMRKLQCPVTVMDYASMDSEGCIYVHPHFVKWPNLENNVNCQVVVIDGGIRDKSKNFTKDKFFEIKTIEVPSNQRFWVNSDAFIVRCFLKETKGKNVSTKLIWEKPFPGMKDSSMPLNEVTIVKDLDSFDDFGNKLRQHAKKIVDRFSVDILGFDSTARTMFFRHLPRSTETMNRLGYHFFYGYTKMADNSMVNLAPILIGDMKEALEKPKHDDSGDLNINWILPTKDKLDPTNLPFIWKMMKEKFGCESLFNEDISMKSLGLFNYPPTEFQPGFREPPADHYYRPYYLAVYKNWTYALCKDGEQLQNEFINIWRRFSHRYKDVCHFGFTFVTTLSHEAGLVLEVVDEILSSHLTELHVAGALDNTLSIIMGDHGNRIGAIQRKYTGRIEERMPLMAIRLPTGFDKKYPDEYRNFLINKHKLTSNFDIHKTLYDIAMMRFGEQRKTIPEKQGRGISFFDEIPSDRSCYDAYVPENFCMCMVDVSNVTTYLAKTKKKPVEEQKKDSFEVLKSWIKDTELEGCISIPSLVMDNNFNSMSINQLARFGMRTKSNVTANAIAMNATVQFNYVNHEFKVTGSFRNDNSLRMLVRTELFVETGANKLVFEPFILEPPSTCQFVSIFDICECLGLLENKESGL